MARLLLNLAVRGSAAHLDMIPSFISHCFLLNNPSSNEYLDVPHRRHPMPDILAPGLASFIDPYPRSERGYHYREPDLILP